MEKALAKVSSTMKTLTDDMEILRQTMQSEKDSIHKGRQGLIDEIARFEEERQRISQVINDTQPVIILLPHSFFMILYRYN